MAERETRKEGRGQLLTELSNAMVTLHREHFGRGPGTAKSFIADDMAVCVLSDIYTPVEQTLIHDGQVDHVRQTRILHQLVLEDEYKFRVQSITGRPVEAFLSMVHVDPDIAVEMFMLGNR